MRPGFGGSFGSQHARKTAGAMQAGTIGKKQRDPVPGRYRPNASIRRIEVGRSKVRTDRERTASAVSPTACSISGVSTFL